MLPHKHAVISATLGAAGWWTTGEPAAGVAAMAAGVLPDIDHAVDYLYYRRRGVHRLILPLHGYEFVLLGTIVALLRRDKILGIAILSYFIHLLADQFVNCKRKLGYSVLFRAWHRFRVDDISTVPEAAIRGRTENMDLLKRLLRRRQKLRR